MFYYLSHQGSPKKAECLRIGASELWCWRRLKPVNPKGNESWIFIGRTDAEAPILWPPDAKSRLIGKDPDAGKDWRQKEKKAKEDEIAEWHHLCNGYEHELGQTPGDGEGQGAARLGVLMSPAQLGDWTTTNNKFCGDQSNNWLSQESLMDAKINRAKLDEKQDIYTASKYVPPHCLLITKRKKLTLQWETCHILI